MEQQHDHARYDIAAATQWAEEILLAAGSTSVNAQIVAEHLTRSDQLGLASHGLSRVIQYVNEIDAGNLQPDADPEIEAVAPTRVIVDGRFGFGQVACVRAATAVANLAQEYGTAAGSVRNVGHTGRISAYTEPLTEQGLVAVAYATGRQRFHWMAPYGGRQGRMSTNPIAWSAPASTDPLTADLAIATIPEGKVRLLRDLGTPAPPDAIADSNGVPTTDPNALYTDPRGTLLPVGGSRHGHKGYALALLSEILSTLLAGDDTADDEGRGNNLLLFAISGDSDLPQRVDRLTEYMRSSEPNNPERPVIVPGEREAATARTAATEGIALEPPVIDALQSLSERFGIEPPPQRSKATQ